LKSPFGGDGWIVSVITWKMLLVVTFGLVLWKFSEEFGIFSLNHGLGHVELLFGLGKPIFLIVWEQSR
jgi:hypothetical protein